ncbi:MAG: PfkB family carbohydrate kinase, partial [Gemmobacter sp.]
MTIYCLGSINLDHTYRVPHIPAPGETLAAISHATGLGGKGANQSVAAARAGATVRHIGAVGPDGGWAIRQLAGYGVDTAHVATVEAATGHAIIAVDDAGENAILLHPGANRAQSPGAIAAALATARTGDTILIQNETDRQAETAAQAAALGLRVIYAAAPFDAAAAAAVLPHAAILILNAIEAAQLAASGIAPACTMVVTRGAAGADWIAPGQPPLHVPAFPVTAADTTGAGDCFTGTLAAALDAGLPAAEAMRRAAAAA